MAVGVPCELWSEKIVQRRIDHGRRCHSPRPNITLDDGILDPLAQHVQLRDRAQKNGGRLWKAKDGGMVREKRGLTRVPKRPSPQEPISPGARDCIAPTIPCQRCPPGLVAGGIHCVSGAVPGSRSVMLARNISERSRPSLFPSLLSRSPSRTGPEARTGVQPESDRVWCQL